METLQIISHLVDYNIRNLFQKVQVDSVYLYFFRKDGARQMKFYGSLALSFQSFLDNNKLKEPTEDMVEKWVNQVLYSYEREANSDVILQMFKIPKKYKKAVEYHEYEVDEESHDINLSKKMLVVRMVLKIKK